MHGRNQLFILDGQTFEGLEPAEVQATAQALRELGLYALPYPTVDLWISANKTLSWSSSRLHATYDWAQVLRDIERGLFIEHTVKCNGVEEQRFSFAPGTGFHFEFHSLAIGRKDITIASHATAGTLSGKFFHCDSTRPVTYRDPVLAQWLCDVLVVLLATRNVEKSTREHKLAAHGIGKGEKRYRYVTRISAPSSAPSRAPRGSPKPRTYAADISGASTTARKERSLKRCGSRRFSSTQTRIGSSRASATTSHCARRKAGVSHHAVSGSFAADAHRVAPRCAVWRRGLLAAS